MEPHHERRSGELAKNLSGRLTGKADDFVELLGAATSDRDSDERQARRWHQQIEEESATWEGTLLDLAEASALVALDTTRGDRLVGQLRAIGSDVIVLHRPTAPDVWIRRSHVATVGLLEGTRIARGSRTASPTTFQELLFAAASGRPRVSFLVSGLTAVLSGVLLSCGTDVCVVRTDADVRRSIIVYVPAVCEATIHG